MNFADLGRGHSSHSREGRGALFVLPATGYNLKEARPAVETVSP